MILPGGPFGREDDTDACPRNVPNGTRRIINRINQIRTSQ